MYEKMEADLDKIAKRENMNRKDAMIAMNDLKKQLEERRDQLGSSEQMRRALSQMKGICKRAPGEKVAKSIEQGNFGQAERRWSSNWPARCEMASCPKKRRSS